MNIIQSYRYHRIVHPPTIGLALLKTGTRVSREFTTPPPPSPSYELNFELSMRLEKKTKGVLP